MRRVSSRELTEWRVYERLEPFGARHQDRVLGLIAALLHNGLFTPHQPSTPETLLPHLRPIAEEADGPEQTLEQQAAILSAWAAGCGCGAAGKES